MSVKAGLFTIAAAALIVGVSGCGSAATTAATSPTTSPTSSTTSVAPTSPAAAPSPSPAVAQAALISIKDYKYTVPASVAPGSKVSVKNVDSENHTITSSTPGAFDVKAESGATATFTAPTKPGSYPFTCTFHANMMGTLVVK